MNDISVSVVIPTYNRSQLICRAINSALGECIPGDEVIVVDDGSTDHTEEKLKPYHDRIRYIRTENTGAGAARNRGIREARNHLIAFLDSDDEWMAGKLTLRRRLLQARPDVLFCFSDMAITHANGEIVRRYLINWHRDERSWDEILGKGVPFSSLASLPPDCEDFSVHCGDMYMNMARAGYIFTSTLVVRREEASEALHFEEGVKTYEDWFCYGRLSRKGVGAYLDTETAWQHGDAGPRLTNASRLVTAETRLLVLGRVWGRDETFMRENGALYEELVQQQHREKAAAYISMGQTGKARLELQHAGRAPVSYRIVAAMPGPLARAMVMVRRFFRAIAGYD